MPSAVDIPRIIYHPPKMLHVIHTLYAECRHAPRDSYDRKEKLYTIRHTNKSKFFA